MSPAAEAAAAVRSVAIPAPGPDPRRRLRAVEAPAPRRRPRLGYAVAAFGGAVAIAVAQMSLSVLTTQTSYELATLDQERRSAVLQAQELSDEVAGLTSPQHLASAAAALGMVIDASPSYLRLSDGKVIGAGAAAGGASTVDAGGRAAVGNALLARAQADAEKTAEPATEKPAAEKKPEAETPAAPEKPAVEVPPPVSDGLPSPTTR